MGVKPQTPAPTSLPSSEERAPAALAKSVDLKKSNLQKYILLELGESPGGLRFGKGLCDSPDGQSQGFGHLFQTNLLAPRSPISPAMPGIWEAAQEGRG